MDLEKRNVKVENDKAWETSMTRKTSIALTTYLFMVLFMNSIGVENYYMSALVPTFGFLLSTFSISRIKVIWEKFRRY